MDLFRKKYNTPLKDFTDEELIASLSHNEVIEISRLGPICAEILRRMNEIKPLLPQAKKD